jgi:hypothetical protein
MIGLAGCLGGTTPSGAPIGSDDERGTADMRAGGSTGDFGGRCLCVPTTRELVLSEIHADLGFSAEEVLSKLEGEYALSMVWGDACASESPGAQGCTDAPPEFTGSETQARITIERAGTMARVEECEPDASMPECPVTSLIIPVAGTLATADGLLNERFELELRAESADAASLGQQLTPTELDGALPERMPELDHVSWSFGLTESDAWFEALGRVSYASTTRSRARSEPPSGGRTRPGHSWGVAVELERARQ